MSEGISAPGIARLQAARAELEAALGDNPLWQALIASADRPTRERCERGLGANPLYRSLCAVNAAIESLLSDNAEITPADHEVADKAGAATNAANAHGSQSSDDLTRIKGIDAGIASALASLGVTRYAQIAHWCRDDVRAASQALGLRKEISRQNWIEQAALLELGRHDRPGQARFVRQREIELADILQAIRVDASARYSEQPSAIVAGPGAPEAPDPAGGVELAQPPVAAGVQREPPPSASVSAIEPTPPPAADAGAAVALAAEQRPRIPTVAASSHVNTDATERAKRLEEERRRLRKADQMSFDTEEAMVSFIIRERSEPPAASATATATTMPARPTQAARTTRRNEGYVPHNSRAEEAEVVVIKPSDGRAHIVESHLFRRGPMRRFLRSLTRS